MTTKTARILIVEDEAEIAELLEENLSALGYATEAVHDGAGMFAALTRTPPDLILLDIMLPGEDGLALCRKLRAPGSPFERTPLIFLTALGELTDRVVGLELGADDYLAKPFEMRELVARIRALLRRAAPRDNDSTASAMHRDAPDILAFGPWRIDMGARNLIDQDGVAIALSAMEFRLLKLFLKHPQRILSREAILNHMTNRTDSFDRSIDVQISRLRAKLGDSGRNAALIRTMRGDGYMLAVPVHEISQES